MAVNVSALDLGRGDLPDRIRVLLDAHGAPPSAISLEITESAVMDNPEVSFAALAALRAAGIKLAIDDFGVGQSSLAQLRRMPVDELKIDKSFLLTLKEDSDEAAIVRSVIDLGHNLGLKVVAEGVEEAEAWNFLLRNRCDLAQGYYVSRPLDADAFEAWLREA